MKTKTIDYINIWLLILSFILAVYLPFELFLFSYAVLGPLHYLTEINWLNEKKYFTKSKSKNYIGFIVFAVFLSLYPILNRLGIDYSGLFKTVLEFFVNNQNILILSCFIFSVSLIFFSRTIHLILAFITSVIFSIVCIHFTPKFGIAVGIFLPTIIHVYVFTLLFMIFGQLKKPTKPGLMGIIILMTVPITITIFDIMPTGYTISNFTKSTYTDSNFLYINTTIANLFVDLEDKKFLVLSPLGIKIQIFIAFAYTYHYLNWFSKTSIIGWKNSISKKPAIYILLLWLSAVAIYFYDYIIGLKALFFLSLLHVILEFPLNILTIKALLVATYKRIIVSSK